MPTGVDANNNGIDGEAAEPVFGGAIDSNIKIETAIGEVVDVDTGLPLPSLPPLIEHVSSAQQAGNTTSQAEETDESKKPAAVAAPTKPSSILKRVGKSSFNFKSDVIAQNNHDTHSNGILHATKSTSLRGNAVREEHVFVWVQANNDVTIPILLGYLQNKGFRASAMKFMPYSKKSAWIARYPHAVPQLVCTATGNITGKLPDYGKEEEDKKMSAAARKKAEKAAAKKSFPKLITHGQLHDAERDELHREIYNYFTFLHDELSVMETNQKGRRDVSLAGVSVPALRTLVAKMEGAFKCVQDEKEKKEGNKGLLSVVGGLPPTAGVAGMPTAMDIDGGLIGGGAASMMNPPGVTFPEAVELPYLEKTLKTEMKQRVICKLAVQIKEEDSKLSAVSIRPKEASWRKVDFDTMLQNLINYQAEKGHTSPPVKHPELGRWVSELRLNKKKLNESGLEWGADDAFDASNLPDGISVEVAQAAAAAASSRKNKKSSNTNTYLTQDRVNRLNAIGFSWSVLPARVSWEERFEELKQFKEQNDRFPTNKEGTIGNWLKAQRKLYTKNDADFMAKKAPQFEAIGLPLRQRHYTALTWDDRFQQLVEFGRVNRHFNVPNPESEDVQIEDHSDYADAKRFYKFVQRVQTEYRSLHRGGTSSLLNEERIAQLRNIGFDFSVKPERIVPDVDWNTRIQQLEAFASEMGHMKVDPNYDKYSNLGGWVVEVSERHKNWQEGREYFPPDELEKFNHLRSMGFGFDVFRSRRGERSWEDSFVLLLQYKVETGNCRVPHHYKADFRLGSWVAVQRKEYKLYCQQKPSKMTPEIIQRLESAGFEWAPRRDQG